MLPRLLAPLAALLALMAAAPAPAAEGTFANAGLTLHYTAEGHGPPVVLLSGGPGFDPGYMRPVGDMVPPGHTVVLLEQRGTGRSVPAQPGPQTVNEDLAVADLEALRVRLGVDRLALVGHSFGTLTAMRYAVAYPGHTSRLVLLGTLAPRAADDTLEANLGARLPPASLAKLGELNAAMGKAAPAEQDAIMMQIATAILPAYLYDQRHAPTVLAGMPAGSIKGRTAGLISASTDGYDLRAGLAGLKLPVLIVQGRADPLDPASAAKTRDAIPGAQLVILEKCGHFAWIEAPDELRAALATFLKD